MERQIQHKALEMMAESLRRNPLVTGVWVLLDLEELGSELVIHQNQDESAELAIYRPNGETEILQGRIIHKRLQRGYPIRQELFVSDVGNKEVILREGEF